MEKLGIKIKNNLQITVKSIHVRFENQDSHSQIYSFGLTLDKLDIITTNE